MRMKKQLLILLLAAVPLMVSAAKLTFYPGTINYRNGESVAYAGIAIPSPNATMVIVTNDPKHKEREKLPVDDIFSIALWHENHPDQVGHLYPLQIEKGNGVQTRICLLEHASEWGAVLQVGDYYAISGKTGELYGMVTSTNGMPIMVRHYLLKSGEETAVLLYTNQSWNPRRSVAAQHFAENKEIADGITSGKLKTTDMAYILDAMAMGESQAVASSDNEDNEEDSPKAAAGKSANSKSYGAKKATPHKGGAKGKAPNARKGATYGVDSDYPINNGVRVGYTNFLSPNQIVEGVYVRNFSYATAGGHIGGRWEQVPEVQHREDDANAPADTIMTSKASLYLGVTMGAQVPIQLGKYYLIPRITAGMMLSPFSFTSESKSMLFAVPLTAGVEFAIPIGADFAFNIGVHYTYDFNFYDTSAYDMKLKMAGQSGLGATIAFCW